MPRGRRHVCREGEGFLLPAPQLLPQSRGSCVSWLTAVSPSKAVAGDGERVTPCSPAFQREAVPQPFRAARLGKIAQLDVCCGVQSARQPRTAMASHHWPPSPRCRVLCLLSQCHVAAEGQALASGASAKAHHPLTREPTFPPTTW